MGLEADPRSDPKAPTGTLVANLQNLARLSYLTVSKFRIVVEARRNRLRIVRNRCVPVCAGYFGFGLAQLEARIRLEIADVRPDP